MNQRLWVASLGLLCVGLVGCGSGNQSLERHTQFVGALNEASDILASVTDDAGAKDARAKLVPVGEKIRELYLTQRISKDTGMDLENLKYDKQYVKEQEIVTAARDRYGKEAARVLALEGPNGTNLVRTMSGYIYPSTAR